MDYFNYNSMLILTVTYTMYVNMYLQENP